MANGSTNYMLENALNEYSDRLLESQCGQSNTGLVRLDNKPFESPRGRRRGNPGLGRENGRPFVSQRGRGRVTHLEAQSEGRHAEIFDHGNERLEHANPISRLVRLDNRPFESPRGRRRGNPGLGRQGGLPFVSQRGRVTNNPASDTYEPSAPPYDYTTENGLSLWHYEYEG